jgi:AAA+ superfamily predicted ATPase
MAKRRYFSCSNLTQDVPPIVRLWILRLLVPLGGHRAFIENYGFQDDNLAKVLGLGSLILEEDKPGFDQKAARMQLNKLHEEAERNLRSKAVPPTLCNNVARLAALAGLSESDCRILEFSILLNTEILLRTTVDYLKNIGPSQAYYIFSVLLDLPEEAVRAAYSSKNILSRSGLVKLGQDPDLDIRSNLSLLSDNFGWRMVSAEMDPVSLLQDIVSLASPAHLEAADYAHIEHSISPLRHYLKRSIATGRKGVNVFVYGAPGTGKSQLARVLANELGCELFEIASEDDDGDPVDGGQRLRAFRAAQSFFSERRAMIVFDEVEDVFDDGQGILGRKSTAQTSKAWINRTLEANPIPSLWLSNSIDGLDPAFIRRFDMVIELPIPPKRHRERIAREACGGLLDASTVSRIAESEHLAPAIIERAASVARLIQGDVDGIEIQKVITSLVSNTLEAQGHRPIKRSDPNRLPEVYDPTYIQADADLVQVTDGLAMAKAGRLCLYGPPGTGKTAFARWLSEQLDMPLVVKRASDVISMWVGGTEKILARAFREAEQNESILLIDEVDSFLQDRRGAQRSWEVTEVNEMLTQMEAFPGIFIASTNLMSGLDQAALRRFDLKVKFDFMHSDQAWQLLHRYCATMAIPAPGPELKPRLARLNVLTPGDFAAVARQHQFRRIDTVAALIAALEQECQLKENAPKAALGFL